MNFRNADATLMTETSYIRGILTWAIDRITKVSDLISKDFMFLWIMPNYDNDLGVEHQQILSKTYRILINEAKLNDWSKDNISDVLRTTAKEIDFPYNRLMKLLRNVLSGLKVSLYYLFNMSDLNFMYLCFRKVQVLLK